MTDQALSNLYSEFGQIIRQIDVSQLQANLAASRLALRRMAHTWHVIESTVSAIKIARDLPKSDEVMVLEMFSQAANECQRGVRIAVELFGKILAPVGLIELLAKNADILASTITLKSLPSIDFAELRAAGLTDVEIVSFVETGISGFGQLGQTMKRFGPTGSLLGSLAHAELAIDGIAGMDISGWRADIVEGHSVWKKVLGALQVDAGALFIFVDIAGALTADGASAGGATVISTPAAVASTCSGVGLVTSGLKEFDD